MVAIALRRDELNTRFLDRNTRTVGSDLVGGKQLIQSVSENKQIF